jgi:hypothetical protein
MSKRTLILTASHVLVFILGFAAALWLLSAEYYVADISVSLSGKPVITKVGGVYRVETPSVPNSASLKGRRIEEVIRVDLPLDEHYRKALLSEVAFNDLSQIKIDVTDGESFNVELRDGVITATHSIDREEGDAK